MLEEELDGGQNDDGAVAEAVDDAIYGRYVEHGGDVAHIGLAVRRHVLAPVLAQRHVIVARLQPIHYTFGHIDFNYTLFIQVASHS